MKKGGISFVLVAAAALLISGCVTTTGPEKTAGSETTTAPEASKAMSQGVTVGIGPGGFHEACEDEWKVGDTVKVSFTSAKPVVFNVHYHDAKEVKHYSIKDVLVDDFSANFTVQDEHVHCGMWQNNSGSFVKLTY
ncbi:MAG: hypothetical protein GQ556_02320 [Desulfobacterales bacterium]|nr:hypothetical protein [Desulfobacterales bacterium]